MSESIDRFKYWKASVWTLADGLPIPDPIHLEVELTGLCNQDCRWCIDIDWRKQGGSFDREVLLRAVEQSRGKAVSLRGGGEPTIHPQFDRIASDLYARGIRLGLVTNGIRRVDSTIFDWISISLDVTNPEDYLKYKGVDNFKETIANAEVYGKHCRTRLTFIIRPDLDVEEVKKLASSLGVKAHFKEMMKIKDVAQIRRSSKHKANPMTPELLRLADDADDLPQNAGLPCFATPLVSHWSYTGDVVLCCGQKEKLLPIGNLNKSDWPTIWNGEEHLRQLRQMASAQATQTCPECRLTGYNRLMAMRIEDEDFV